MVGETIPITRVDVEALFAESPLAYEQIKRIALQRRFKMLL